MSSAPIANRIDLGNGKSQYVVDGETLVASSKVVYTHVSLYVAQGERFIFLHKSPEAAAKVSPDAARMGLRDYRVGAFPIATA